MYDEAFIKVLNREEEDDLLLARTISKLGSKLNTL